MKSFILSLFFITALVAQTATDEREEFEYVRHQIRTSHSFVPKGGFVPDKETAIAIAYAVSAAAYGRNSIDEEKPLRADLKGSIWTVLGTLHGARIGGTLIVQIDKRTGRILYLNHSM
jgi:hypothetical protein